MSAPRVLLVDDDVELVAILREYLEGEDFAVTVAQDGQAAIAEALTGEHDILVLDVMMPRMNGIEVLKRVRTGSQLPVLMLTARGDETDRVIGLELGADDYVPKPCSGRELVARIRAILRRTLHGDADETTAEPIRGGSIWLWPSQRRAELAGEPLELTSTEFNLLELLARNAGHVVSKSDLSQRALGRPLARYDRSIDVHLANIRRKLNHHGAGDCIKTVFRRGYQLVAE